MGPDQKGKNLVGHAFGEAITLPLVCHHVHGHSRMNVLPAIVWLAHIPVCYHACDRAICGIATSTSPTALSDRRGFICLTSFVPCGILFPKIESGMLWRKKL